MDEVCDDRRPHEAEEIENLSFYNHQLQKNTNSKHIISWQWLAISVNYFQRVLNFKIIYFDKLLTKACQRIEHVLVL